VWWIDRALRSVSTFWWVFVVVVCRCGAGDGAGNGQSVGVVAEADEELLEFGDPGGLSLQRIGRDGAYSDGQMLGSRRRCQPRGSSQFGDQGGGVW
jgi:hypothetical protein